MITPSQIMWDEQLESEAEEASKALTTSRYKLKRKVGRGCWGDVYKARDLVLGIECAIKVLNPDEIALEQMNHRNLTPIKAMSKEAGLAACSYIVPRSFELDETGKPFIVMPFYQRFLSNILLNRQRISTKESLEEMLDIAKGLSEMHTIRRRAHGDLKPDNIAVDETGKYISQGGSKK